MGWRSFAGIRDGTRILNHGYDQCVAVFNRFHEGVLGKPFVPVASASQLWTAFNNYPALRTNYRKSSNPVAGAVMVWDRSWGGGHGHVGVVLATHGDGTVTVLEQNATQRWTHRYRRPRRMPGLLGYLIPNNNPATRSAEKQSAQKSVDLPVEGMEDMFMMFTDGYKGGRWALIGSAFVVTTQQENVATALHNAIGGSAKPIARLGKREFDVIVDAAKLGHPKK